MTIDQTIELIRQSNKTGEEVPESVVEMERERIDTAIIKLKAEGSHERGSYESDCGVCDCGGYCIGSECD